MENTGIKSGPLPIFPTSKTCPSIKHAVPSPLVPFLSRSSIPWLWQLSPWNKEGGGGEMLWLIFLQPLVPRLTHAAFQPGQAWHGALLWWWNGQWSCQGEAVVSSERGHSSSLDHCSLPFQNPFLFSRSRRFSKSWDYFLSLINFTSFSHFLAYSGLDVRKGRNLLIGKGSLYNTFRWAS